MKLMVNRKAFGEKVILEDFTLTIKEGERIAIKGASGIGKTTILRLISRLDRDFEGKIEEPFQRPIILFQEDRLVEGLTVMANLRALGAKRDDIRPKLATLGLEGEENTLVSNLSGGMKRRVAVLRLFLIPYDLLLLDEPFSGLDDETKERTAAFILKENSGRAIVLVSHEEEDFGLLDITRIIDLDGGEHEKEA